MSKPTMATCYHEAGHALAAMRYRFGFSRVVIASDGAIVDLRGRVRADAAGLAEGMGDETYLADILAATAICKRPPLIEDAFRKIVVTLAGPVAEARATRKSLTAILLSGGQSDWKRASAVATIVAAHIGADDCDAVLTDAEHEARHFCQRYWREVSKVAALLGERTSLNWDEVTATCSIPRMTERLVALTPTYQVDAA